MNQRSTQRPSLVKPPLILPISDFPIPMPSLKQLLTIQTMMTPMTHQLRTPCMMQWTHLHLCPPLPLLPLPLKITMPAFDMHHHSSTQIPLACIQYQATISFILGEWSHRCCNSKALFPLPPHMPGVFPLLGPLRGSSCFTA